MALVILIVIATLIALGLYYFKSSGINPFEKDCRQPLKQKEFDEKKRDSVLRQNFSGNKIPKDLDVIVIGSGIGGLSTAAILSKAGKKVLVLEQHDRAGGCCHTFTEKGYEFDTGIHYLGAEFLYPSITRTLIDQISDGQIEFEPMDKNYDTAIIKEKDTPIKSYEFVADRDELLRNLKNAFPKETEAIDKFFNMVKKATGEFRKSFIVKFLPIWLVSFLIKLNMFRYFTKFWEYNKTLTEVLNELTDNEELKCVLSYCYGDYGTQPNKAGFWLHALILDHYMEGASYPIGGSSEIGYNIIPVIERSGGRVLVRAEVVEIIINNGLAVGVKVKHGRTITDIYAPTIVSNAGATNTFNKFLPKDVSRESGHLKVMKEVPLGPSSITIFIGMNASPEELGIPPKKNFWIFTEKDQNKAVDDFLNKNKDECEVADVPFSFLSFPSTKDPTWNQRFPGKTTAVFITLANYKWFQEWEDKPVLRRGDDYEAKKKTIAHKVIDHMIDLFPKTKEYIDHIQIGSPLSYNHYMGTQQGEVYGLDHCNTRFTANNMSRMRSKTHIKGLYLTGQDIMTAGFPPAMMSGIFCAQQILQRNIYNDLLKLKNSIKKARKKAA